MRRCIPVLLLLLAVLVVPALCRPNERIKFSNSNDYTVAKASVDKLNGDKVSSDASKTETQKMKDNPAFKAFAVDYYPKEESQGDGYQQQQQQDSSYGGQYKKGQADYSKGGGGGDGQKDNEGYSTDLPSQEAPYGGAPKKGDQYPAERHEEYAEPYYPEDTGKGDNDYGPDGCKDKDNCPTPQQADDVKQAYLAHGKFIWRELAAQDEAKKYMSASKSSTNKNEQQGKASIHRIKSPILKQLAKQQSKLQGKQQKAVAKTQMKADPDVPQFLEATQDGQPQPAAASSSPQQSPAQLAPAAQSGVSIAAVSATASGKSSSKDSKVSVAAVDNLQHLWPTSKDQTDYGFSGVLSQHIPSDEALAVGPHPIDPEAVMLIHGVQGFFDVFMVTLDDGKPVPTGTPTKLHVDDMMATTGLDLTNIYGVNPSAWYDTKEKRYVLMWSTAIIDEKQPLPTVAYPLFVAVSCTNNPLGEWTVWALDTVPQVAPGGRFCAGQPLNKYAANTPQGTYSDEMIAVGLGVYCGDFSKDDGYSFLSVLYVYSKEALYAKPPLSGIRPSILAAMYLGSTSWYRSVPPSGQALVEDAFKPFNNFIQPARPQEKEDVSERPMFVMKVSDTMMSVATLTGDPLSKMTSKDSAPKIVATVVGKGGDFSNLPGQLEGIPAMPQPGTFRTLNAGDVGTMNRTYELRTYWATHHKGLLYFTTSEFWGSGAIRMPSVYYGIVQPGAGLCAVSRLEWGVVASQDGLALAYPVIAARKETSATLAFAYSGAGSISDGVYPANPGVATAQVGEGSGYGLSPTGEGLIQVAKRGPGVIDRDETADPQHWGTYSAAQVFAGKLWYAVVIPQAVEDELKHGSWVGAVDLSYGAGSY